MGVNLRSRMSIGATGKVVSAFDLVRLMALCADWYRAARNFILARRCICAQSCRVAKCPTSVSTQDPQRQPALVVPDKAERVHNFHPSRLRASKKLVQVAGKPTWL